MDSISFPLVQANNLPLGSQSETAPAPSLIIDLTTEDSAPTNNVPSTTPARTDVEDDDIIFTGEHFPDNHPSSNPSNQNRPQPPRSTNHIHPANLSGRMATLTANIYAGHYSRHLRTDPTPQQGSSNLVVRESTPLQTRSSNSRTIHFGGGGRFSGGRFSGFLAAGFNAGWSGLRNFANGNLTGAYQQPEENLEQVFSNWGTNERSPPSGLMNPQLRGNLLALSPHEIFAAIYDFDHIGQSREPAQPPYKETDSHPLKIKPGFSKEIIPLDREVLSLDSDSPSNPLPEKQELRPICASCNRDLLMGQDSGVGSSNGRRPWILACGHVVDCECLEKAKMRAMNIKLETQSRKEKNKAAATTSSTPKSSVQTRGRPTRNNNHNQTNDAIKPTTLSSNKRRKVSCNNSTYSGKSSSQVTTSISESALKRKERADAREARKSAEFNKSSFNLFDSRHNPNNPSSTDSNQSPLVNDDSTPGVNVDSKGKGKAKEGEATIGSIKDNLHEDQAIRQVVNPPTDTSTSKTKNVNNSSLDSELVSPSINTNNNNKNNQTSPADAHLNWIKCPVKGCRANKGDLLASPGSKNAPWEMFV